MTDERDELIARLRAAYDALIALDPARYDAARRDRAVKAAMALPVSHWRGCVGSLENVVEAKRRKAGCECHSGFDQGTGTRPR